MSDSETDVNSWSDVESMISGSTLCTKPPPIHSKISYWAYTFLAYYSLFQAYFFSLKPSSAIIAQDGTLTHDEKLSLGLSMAMVYITGGVATWLLWSHVQLMQGKNLFEGNNHHFFMSVSCALIIFLSGVLIGAGAHIAGVKLCLTAFIIVALIFAFRFLLYMLVCYGLYVGLSLMFTREQLAAQGIFLRLPSVIEYFQ